MSTEQSGVKLEIFCLKGRDFDMHKKTSAQCSRTVIMYICSYLAWPFWKQWSFYVFQYLFKRSR